MQTVSDICFINNFGISFFRNITLISEAHTHTQHKYLKLILRLSRLTPVKFLGVFSSLTIDIIFKKISNNIVKSNLCFSGNSKPGELGTYYLNKSKSFRIYVPPN